MPTKSMRMPRLKGGMGKKLLVLLVVGVLLYLVVKFPAESADQVSSGVSALRDAADALGTFVSALFK